MRGSFSLFYNIWLTVFLLYHTTLITDEPFKLILLGVALEATVFLFEVPTGVMADAYSRKWSSVIGLLLMGSAYLLEGAFLLYGTVFLAQIIHGLGFTFYSGASDAWLADEIGMEKATPVYVRGSQVSLVCGQFGILSAILIGQISLQIALMVAGVGAIILGVVLILFMQENGFMPDESIRGVRARMRQTTQNSVNALRLNPALIVVVMVGLIIGLSLGGFDRLFTPHFLTYDPPYDPVVWYGILFGIISLCSALILEWIRKRARMITPEAIRRTIALLYAGTIVGNIMFVLAGNFGMALLAFWFSQMLRTTVRPLIIIWINTIAESHVRATSISMYWQSNALGHIIGLPIIGVIGSLFTLRIALMTAVIALTPAVILLARSPTKTAESIVD